MNKLVIIKIVMDICYILKFIFYMYKHQNKFIPLLLCYYPTFGSLNLKLTFSISLPVINVDIKYRTKQTAQIYSINLYSLSILYY